MIDYSNGYPVQITTNVTANTPWSEVIKKNGNPFTNWSSDGWYPENYERVCEDIHYEAYKEVFLKLKYHGIIPSNTSRYYDELKRYEKKYNHNKTLKKKVDEYIEMTHQLNTKPTNKFKFKYYLIPIVERTEFGKNYYKLENELIIEFNKI